MSNNKPMPVATPISAPFWEGLKARRLLIQQCNACAHWNFYPRRHCPVCLEHDLAWREVDAKGNRLLRFTGVDKNAAAFESLPAQDSEPAPATSQQPVALQVDLNDGPALQALVSEQYSDWSNVVVVDQALIDAFAQLSGDDYWIHTDPQRARLQSPFGGTIAHGALVQVLQSRMKLALGFEISGFSTQINYGSDRLRFPAPVPAGSRIHSRARVKKVEILARGTQLTLELNIHVVGQDRPSVINDLVILYIA